MSTEMNNKLYTTLVDTADFDQTQIQVRTERFKVPCKSALENRFSALAESSTGAATVSITCKKVQLKTKKACHLEHV